MTAMSSPKIDLRSRLVADYMRQGIVRCAPDTPLSEVAQLIGDHRIHSVVVGERAEPIGVISTLDVARARRSRGLDRRSTRCRRAPLHRELRVDGRARRR